MEKEIRIDKITKLYGEKKILSNFSAVIPKGKITCIMGPSGCGKTTLLNILLRLRKPDQGVITGMEGMKLAAVFQEDRLLEELDAVMNIQVADGIMNRKSIEEELALVGITQKDNQPVAQFSGGMKRRVAIVRAMMIESDFIALDEPLKGLDTALKETMLSYLQTRLQNKTAVFITHELEDAHRLAQHIIHME